MRGARLDWSACADPWKDEYRLLVVWVVCIGLQRILRLVAAIVVVGGWKWVSWLGQGVCAHTANHTSTRRNLTIPLSVLYRSSNGLLRLSLVVNF